MIYDKADGSATKMKELLGTDEALQAALALTGKNAKEPLRIWRSWEIPLELRKLLLKR